MVGSFSPKSTNSILEFQLLLSVLMLLLLSVQAQLNEVVTRAQQSPSDTFRLDDRLYVWLDPYNISTNVYDGLPVRWWTNIADPDKSAAACNTSNPPVIVKREPTRNQPLVALDGVTGSCLRFINPKNDAGFLSDFSKGFTVTFVYYSLGRAENEHVFDFGSLFGGADNIVLRRDGNTRNLVLVIKAVAFRVATLFMNEYSAVSISFDPMTNRIQVHKCRAATLGTGLDAQQVDISKSVRVTNFIGRDNNNSPIGRNSSSWMFGDFIIHGRILQDYEMTLLHSYLISKYDLSVPATPGAYASTKQPTSYSGAPASTPSGLTLSNSITYLNVLSLGALPNTEIPVYRWQNAGTFTSAPTAFVVGVGNRLSVPTVSQTQFGPLVSLRKANQQYFHLMSPTGSRQPNFYNNFGSGFTMFIVARFLANDGTASFFERLVELNTEDLSFQQGSFAWTRYERRNVLNFIAGSNLQFGDVILPGQLAVYGLRYNPSTRNLCFYRNLGCVIDVVLNTPPSSTSRVSQNFLGASATADAFADLDMGDFVFYRVQHADTTMAAIARSLMTKFKIIDTTAGVTAIQYIEVVNSVPSINALWENQTQPLVNNVIVGAVQIIDSNGDITATVSGSSLGSASTQAYLNSPTFPSDLPTSVFINLGSPYVAHGIIIFSDWVMDGARVNLYDSLMRFRRSFPLSLDGKLCPVASVYNVILSSWDRPPSYEFFELPIPVTRNLRYWYDGRGFAWVPNSWLDHAGRTGNPTFTNFAQIQSINMGLKSYNPQYYLSGTTSTAITFPGNINQNSHTIVNLARYQPNGSNRRRILTSGNWFSGFSENRTGVFFHTSSSNSLLLNDAGLGNDDWVLSIDQWNMYRANFQLRSRPGSASRVGSGFPIGVNVRSADRSDYNLAEVIYYDTELTAIEISQMENWLNWKHALSQPSTGFRFMKITSASFRSIILGDITLTYRQGSGTPQTITTAYKFQAHSSSIVYPGSGLSRCTDGDMATYCATAVTTEREWILIDFGAIYTITKLQLFLPRLSYYVGLSGCQIELLDFYMTVKASAMIPNGGAPSYSITMTTDMTNITSVTADPFVAPNIPDLTMARMLYIYPNPSTRILDIQELEVFDEQDAKIKVDVFANSVRALSDNLPMYMTDGISNYIDRSTKTLAPFYSNVPRNNSYLIVDLGADRYISRIFLLGRSDCCDMTLRNASVIAVNAIGTPLYNRTFSGLSTAYTVNGDSPVTYQNTGIRYVRITSKNNVALAIADIGLFLLNKEEYNLRVASMSSRNFNGSLFNIIDGDMTTIVRTTASGSQWIELDYERPVSLQKLTIYVTRAEASLLQGATMTYHAPDRSIKQTLSLGQPIPVPNSNISTLSFPSDYTCDFGYFLSNGRCTACPLGTFKGTYSNATSCDACPTNSTTYGTAAYAPSFCECKLGYFRNETGFCVLDPNDFLTTPTSSPTPESPTEGIAAWVWYAAGGGGGVVVALSASVGLYVLIKRRKQESEKKRRLQEILNANEQQQQQAGIMLDMFGNPIDPMALGMMPTGMPGMMVDPSLGVLAPSMVPPGMYATMDPSLGIGMGTYATMQVNQEMLPAPGDPMMQGFDPNMPMQPGYNQTMSTQGYDPNMQQGFNTQGYDPTVPMQQGYDPNMQQGYMQGNMYQQKPAPKPPSSKMMMLSALTALATKDKKKKKKKDDSSDEESTSESSDDDKKKKNAKNKSKRGKKKTVQESSNMQQNSADQELQQQYSSERRSSQYQQQQQFSAEQDSYQQQQFSAEQGSYQQQQYFHQFQTAEIYGHEQQQQQQQEQYNNYYQQ